MNTEDSKKNTASQGGRPVWEQLDYQHDAIIEASAGTGKTYALEHIVKYLVTEKKVDIRNLLLVTFTEKAAGELKERIRKILEGNTDAARHLDEATICTIHSFCRELLDVYPFESGMQMASEVQNNDDELVDSAAHDLLTKGESFAVYGGCFGSVMALANCKEASSLAEKLAHEAKKVISGIKRFPPQVGDEDQLKEEVHTAAVAIQDQMGTRSFRDWAFDGMVLNARAKPGAEARYQELSTLFARFANAAIDAGTWMVAIARFAELDRSVENAFNTSVNGHGRGVRLFDLKPDLQRFIEALENCTAAYSGKILQHLVSCVVNRYNALKKRSRTITFDDMVLETSRCIREAVADTDNAAKQAFLKAIRTRYWIALVDEFQDTDDKQWTIFRSLFSHAVNQVDGANPQQGCLIVVGDPKQAIYRFRGADIDTYLRARREITGGDDTKVFRLCEMYRSTEQMVEAFNKIFGVVSADDAGWFKGMHSLEGEIAYGDGVRFPKGDPPASVKDFRYPDGESAVELLESLPDGEAVAAKAVALPLVLENMAMEMKRLHESKFWMQDQPPKNRMDWNAMCVLGKSHADCEAAKKVLQRRGIPCRIYKEAGLFDSAESESVLALFDYLTMPRSNGNLAALLLTPFFRTPLCGIENCLLQENAAFDRLTDRWRSLIAKREWVRFFESALNDTELGRAHPEDPEFLRHRAGVRQIFDQLLESCGRARGLSVMADTLRRWRRDDSAAGETGSVREKESEADAVQIMTMHAAKGLEFNAVFVPYGFSGVINERATPKEDRPAAEMEVRRLLYVALTRAKFKLYLPWSGKVADDTFGEGTALGTFLGGGIRSLYGDDASMRVRGGTKLPPKNENGNTQKPSGEKNEGAKVLPELPPHRGMMGWRFKWDSFSSMNHPAAAKAVEVEDAKPVGDEFSGLTVPGVEDVEPKQPSLLPKGALSGTVFHEVMEILCGNDGIGDRVGFEIGKKDFSAVVAETAEKKSPLMEIVRRRLSANGVANRIGETPDRTTAHALARMAWNALRAPLDFEKGTIQLCEVLPGNRRAEVGFVLDEGLLRNADADRTGALNGSVDLLFRVGEDYYIVDWKTNALEDYEPATVKKDMDAVGYHLQYDIYTLAVEKWLGVGKVKGVAYLFVRGGEFGEFPGVFLREIKDEDREKLANTLARRLTESDRAEAEKEKEEM